MCIRDSYHSFFFVKVLEHDFDNLALLRWHKFANVVGLNWEFAMFFAAVDKHRKLHTSWTSEVDQLIECGANRTAGVENIVYQYDVSTLDVSGKLGSVDDWFRSDGLEIIAIESYVENTDWRSRTFKISDLVSHTFGERNSATADANERLIAGSMIFFEDF